MKLLKNIVLSSTLMETVVGTFQDFIRESNNNKEEQRNHYFLNGNVFLILRIE